MAINASATPFLGTQTVEPDGDPTIKHPNYLLQQSDWERVRDAVQSESVIKSKGEKYLPRPAGMSGEYADAYDGYIERAHYPQICAYALQGALGVIITKLPEFNVPKSLEYLKDNATKDGRTLKQLFMDTVVEILLTGKCPLVVDIVPETNEFKFVQYTAEAFTNWKEDTIHTEKSMILGVLREAVPNSDDIFSHDTVDVYRVLSLNANGDYTSRLFESNGAEIEDKFSQPNYMGRTLDEIPLFVAGSINNSTDAQPIPLLSVANCSIQIYRKEADLANSEYLSCNPTLCMVGASNDDDLPNVVGSSVMLVLPDPAARIFYTTTDTAALKHVKTHIDDLYDEAIRHGVAILDTRKGVESAEALRIRQSTQSASIYSIYLSALTAILDGIKMMCKWGGANPNEVIADAPSALTYGIPDSNVIREILDGFGQNVVPLSVVHRYLVGAGLLDQTISEKEYLADLVANKKIFDAAGLTVNPDATKTAAEIAEEIEDAVPTTEDDGDGDGDGEELTQAEKAMEASKGSGPSVNEGAAVKE